MRSASCSRVKSLATTSCGTGGLVAAFVVACSASTRPALSRNDGADLPEDGGGPDAPVGADGHGEGPAADAADATADAARCDCDGVGCSPCAEPEVCVRETRSCEPCPADYEYVDYYGGCLSGLREPDDCAAARAACAAEGAIVSGYYPDSDDGEWLWYGEDGSALACYVYCGQTAGSLISICSLGSCCGGVEASCLVAYRYRCWWPAP